MAGGSAGHDAHLPPAEPASSQSGCLTAHWVRLPWRHFNMTTTPPQMACKVGLCTSPSYIFGHTNRLLPACLQSRLLHEALTTPSDG